MICNWLSLLYIKDTQLYHFITHTIHRDGSICVGLYSVEGCEGLNCMEWAICISIIAALSKKKRQYLNVKCKNGIVQWVKVHEKRARVRDATMPSTHIEQWIEMPQADTHHKDMIHHNYVLVLVLQHAAVHNASMTPNYATFYLLNHKRDVSIIAAFILLLLILNLTMYIYVLWLYIPHYCIIA